MARYFTISAGLRGCYMPDTCYEVRCETRRELKSALQSEADMQSSELTVGLTKKHIAWLAARAWREYRAAKPAYLPFVAPFKNRGQSDYPYGIFCSVSNRADYLAYQRDTCD